MTTLDDDPFAGVAALGAAFRSGFTTPLRVVERALERAALLEPHLNAIIDPMREAALAAAEVATRELASGTDRGPLHGIPVAIKDIIDVAGVPTTYATRAVDPAQPTADAALVRNMRAAGAVPFAKTNLLEFAYGIAHPAIGQTNNPWDVTLTAGGSSGGSAALVAAGIVPLAVGTDTGGSIRIPASYCGIVGLKPTYGLVQTAGIFPLAWSLDHAGPLARSVADAGVLLSGLVGRLFESQARPLAGLHIGVVAAHLQSPHVTAGVRAVVTAAIERLRDGGAIVTQVTIAEGDVANRGLMTILLPEATLAHRAIAARPEGYAAGTLSQLQAGHTVSGIDTIAAQHLQGRLRVAVEALFATVDVLLSPSVGFVAPREDPVIEGDDGGGEMLSCGLANMTGHPALSLPCGISEGLPVGLHLIGAHGRDARLLADAATIEARLAFTTTPRLAALG